MNQLRVLSLTTLLLMLASRLPGQFGQPPPQPQQGVQIYGQPVVCNDGTILFSVARAYREANVFSADTWQVEGWYNVEPGKCEKIGPVNLYYKGGLERTPLPFSLLRSATPPARGGPSRLGLLITTAYGIHPISSFALDLREPRMIGIRRGAISHGRAMGSRRGIRWFPRRSNTGALGIPALGIAGRTNFTSSLVQATARFRWGRKLRAVGLPSALVVQPAVGATAMRVPACAERSRAGISSSSAWHKRLQETMKLKGQQPTLTTILLRLNQPSRQDLLSALLLPRCRKDHAWLRS